MYVQADSMESAVCWCRLVRTVCFVGVCGAGVAHVYIQCVYTMCKRLFNLLPQFSRLGTWGPASLSLFVWWGFRLLSLLSRILFNS